MQNFTWIRKPAFVALALLLTLSGCSTAKPAEPATSPAQDGQPAVNSPAPLEKVTMRLNWTYYGEHTPFLVAKEKKFFEKHGLDVEVAEGNGSGTTLKLVGNKQADLGWIDAGTAAKGIAQGIPVKVVGSFIQVNPMAVIFPADQNITKPSDLVGKQIAITQGDALSQIFPAFLDSNGVNPNDVSMVAMGTPAAKEAAMLQKQVDGLLGYYFEQAPRIEEREKIKLGVLRFSDFGITLYNMSLVAHNDTIAQRGDVIRKFVAALTEGWRYAEQNPAEAAEIFVKVAPQFSKTLAQQQFEKVTGLTQTPATKGKPLGWMDQGDWEQGLRLLKEFGDLAGEVKPELYYTNEFISDK